MTAAENLNWNEMWQESMRHEEFGGSDFWDKFAPHFRKKNPGEKDEYVEGFLRCTGLREGETVFDMGCGAGTLAIPIALQGHQVYAADFSRGMLKQLMLEAADSGVDHLIHPIHLSWDEDWDDKDLPLCDVAISSRSLFCKDLTSSLLKLESVSSRRSCISLFDTPTSGYDRYAARAIGYERTGIGPFAIVLNELLALDRFPQLMFFSNHFRLPKYHSYEEGYNNLRASFVHPLSGEQEQKLRDYYDEHIVHHVDAVAGLRSPRGDAAGSSEFWQLDHNDEIFTSFIRWDRETAYTK
ncbi:MAG: class I SAM-dependent methyltransferase [Anaerovoracaceae bacterium]|jgi:hypothetical protein